MCTGFHCCSSINSSLCPSHICKTFNSLPNTSLQVFLPRPSLLFAHASPLTVIAPDPSSICKLQQNRKYICANKQKKVKPLSHLSLLAVPQAIVFFYQPSSFLAATVRVSCPNLHLHNKETYKTTKQTHHNKKGKH